MSEIKKTKALPARSEIKVEDTWNLEDIFATDEAWEQEYQQVKELLKADEKVDQIRIYSGLSYTTVNEVTSGDICVVTGLNGSLRHDTACVCKYNLLWAQVPTH